MKKIIILLICITIFLVSGKILYTKFESSTYPTDLWNLLNNKSIDSNFIIPLQKNILQNSTPQNPHNQSNLIFPHGNISINGLPLANVIKGNSEIAQTAQNITKSYSSNLKKSIALYLWIAINIHYCNTYVKNVSQGTLAKGEGTAIDVFNSHEAICTGFASLYFVMARDINIPVRLISGIGGLPNKNNWGGHMWNEVYIDNQWIPVDTTFANAYTVDMQNINTPPRIKGFLSNKNTTISQFNLSTITTYTVPASDYFATSNFYESHKEKSLVAQWIP